MESSSVDQVFEMVAGRSLGVNERSSRLMDGEGVALNDVTQVEVSDVSSIRVHVGYSCGDSCPPVLNLFVASLPSLKLLAMISYLGTCSELAALCYDGPHMCADAASSVVAPHVGCLVLLWVSP